MNSFGQQNDFLVQIFFFVVSYTTDHRICFLRVRNCHKLIETYCFVRCVLQSIERQAWSSLSSKERSSLVVNAKKTTNILTVTPLADGRETLVTSSGLFRKESNQQLAAALKSRLMARRALRF